MSMQIPRRRGRPKKEKLSYDAAKDAAIEQVILHMLHPQQFDINEDVTFEDIALLFSKDKSDIKSKMWACKLEAKALSKIRDGLGKYGIKKLEDVFSVDRGHRWATRCGVEEN